MVNLVCTSLNNTSTLNVQGPSQYCMDALDIIHGLKN